MPEYSDNTINQATGNVGAVMVLFEPDWKVTAEAIASLAPQVKLLCIIDNTPDADNSDRFTGYDNILYIPLKKNSGIAAAQNIGIRHLSDNGYQFILFSDQDTLAPSGIVQGLIKDYHLLKDRGYNIGLIGPTPVNKSTGQPYDNPVRVIRHLECGSRGFTECRFIISSFSLVPTAHFRTAGLYHESLFIDFVENEWCFRLKLTLGLSAYISRQLEVRHSLGVSRTFLGKQINVSSPFRLYFQIRNYFWVRQLDYVSSEWLRQVKAKLIAKLFYYPIIPRQRLAYLRSITRGLRDGLYSKPDFLTLSRRDT